MGSTAATSAPPSLCSSSALLLNAKAPSALSASSCRPESSFLGTPTTTTTTTTHLIVTCSSTLAPPPVSAAAAASSSSSSSSVIQYHAKPTPAYYRKIGRNVVVNATAGEVAPPAPADMATIQTPEILKTIQETWNKVEDKYAVSSLAVAGGVALCTCWGAISAIDKLPLIPGVLELVGIGYSGWFAYRNLIFKPDRDALICKIKETYKEIIGSS